MRTGWRSELNPSGQLWTVVGVVGDTFQAGLDQAIRPQIYISATRMGLDGGRYVLRAARGDAGLAAAVSEAVRSVDPQLERIRIHRLEEWVSDSLGPRRVPVLLTGAFAGIGLLLTVLGLYGTVAFQVGRRRREIAIRMALGAGNGSVLGLVMRHGMALVAAGAALGTLAFAAGSRVLESQLYGVGTGDPLTAATVIAILALSGALACLIPARAAMRVEPVSILKDVP
jgi:predicted lysophospholipase L1 biosynthesis ABC-type transport system permease subunit